MRANQFLDIATAPYGVYVDADGRAYVITIHEQRAFIEAGDWIIEESSNCERHYPCKPNVFAAFYEPCEGNP